MRFLEIQDIFWGPRCRAEGIRTQQRNLWCICCFFQGPTRPSPCRLQQACENWGIPLSPSRYVSQLLKWKESILSPNYHTNLSLEPISHASPEPKSRSPAKLNRPRQSTSKQIASTQSIQVLIPMLRYGLCSPSLFLHLQRFTRRQLNRSDLPAAALSPRERLILTTYTPS